jgi:dTDP-4-dehydrorhamnose 3,5-epimerase
MKLIETELPEIKIIEQNVFNDERGFFFESFNLRNFNSLMRKNYDFVQDNISFSKKGTLRGLHAQSAPFSQGKLIKVLNGGIFDVAVDIRPNSHSFGKYVSVLLTSKNFRQLWVPEGFAHGFLALEENTLIEYKTTNYYSKDNELIYKWDDPYFNINWPKLDLPFLISNKDNCAPYLTDKV